MNLQRQVESMAILEAILLCDPFNIIPGWTPIRENFMKNFWLKLTTCVGSLLKRCKCFTVFLFDKKFPEKFCTIDYHGKLDGQSKVILNNFFSQIVIFIFHFIWIFVYSQEGCLSFFEFQIEKDNLQSARQKALINYKIERKMCGKSYKKKALGQKTEIERRTDIVRLLLELRKERQPVDLRFNIWDYWNC